MIYYSCNVDLGELFGLSYPRVNSPVGEADGLPLYDRTVMATHLIEAFLFTATRAVEAAFKEIGAEIKDQYSWSDGSLYFYVSREAPIVNAELPLEVREAVTLTEVSPGQDPGKFGVKTVEEYMAFEGWDRDGEDRAGH